MNMKATTTNKENSLIWLDVKFYKLSVLFAKLQTECARINNLISDFTARVIFGEQSQMGTLTTHHSYIPIISVKRTLEP